MVMFLWMMPMPPSCAMVMARRASVTVSMAAGEDGQPQAHAARELRAEVDFSGEDVGAAGNQEDVVECEGFFEDSHDAFYARAAGG